MFSHQNVIGANIVSLDDEKNGNFWKMAFYPKMMFFSQYLIFFSIFSQTMIYPKDNLANSIFLGVKDTQIWPEKKINPLRD